jgi:predicted component of type VI protein secretion system
MPAQLVALNDGPSILVDKPILLLGRHPECDIQIDSRKISRRHCCIAQVNNYLVGVRINGVRVVEGRLDAGDELTVGNHRYQVSWDENPVVNRPAPPRGVVTPPRPQPPRLPASTGKAVPLVDDDDELLEECDEPVALPDPGRVPPPPPAQARSRPEPLTPLDNSLVLPDNLELIPRSGSFPGAAPPKT